MDVIEAFLARPALAKFPFVFVVTYGRSGSTLLLGLLNALPGYCIRGENAGALLPLFRSVKALRQARYRWGRTTTGTENPWYGADLVSPEAFGRGCASAFVRTVLQPPPDSRSVGFKEVRYTDDEIPTDKEFFEYLDFLSSIFPGAAFIFNFRDIEATAASGWWKQQDAQAVRQRLSNAVERLKNYAGAHPENTMAFNYDRLVANPSGEFSALCEFLNETFDEAALARIMEQKHSLIGGKP